MTNSITDLTSEDRPEDLLFQHFTAELSAGGYGFRFQARGRSMYPTIKDGDLLDVVPLAGRQLHLGDIVLFRTAASRATSCDSCFTGLPTKKDTKEYEGIPRPEFRAHRIVARHEKLFVMRGDAGIDSDCEVPQEHIIGLVVARESAAIGRKISLYGLGPRAIFMFRQLRWRSAKSTSQ